jgi:putative intracellular protease/amidase
MKQAMTKKKKRVLIVVSNPAISTTTGWPVGFWASELTHAYERFQEEGFDITIASPLGGKVVIDSLSYPRDQSGYSKDDKISLRYLQDKNFVKLLDNTQKVSELSPADYDAIVVVGGQGPMFSFKNATGLQNKFLEFYNKGKISAALCHGTSLLLYKTKYNDQEEQQFSQLLCNPKVVELAKKIEAINPKIKEDTDRSNSSSNADVF